MAAAAHALQPGAAPQGASRMCQWGHERRHVVRAQERAAARRAEAGGAAQQGAQLVPQGGGGGPGAGERRCNGDRPAEWYCPDCDCAMCAECSWEKHAALSYLATRGPYARNPRYHSLERIAEEDRWHMSVASRTILPLLVLALVAIAATGAAITPDYADSELCPMVDAARKHSTRIDTRIFQWYKKKFHRVCVYEDSFWKAFTDVWVRNVLTDSDSLLLIFAQLPSLVAGYCGVVYVFAPFVGAVLSCIAAAVVALELRFRAPHYILQRADRINGYLGSPPPPITLPRERADIHALDKWLYRGSRYWRYFGFFYRISKGVLRSTAKHLALGAVALRIASIGLGLHPLLRGLAILHGMGGTIRAQEQWFTGWSGDRVQDTLVDLAWQHTKHHPRFQRLLCIASVLLTCGAIVWLFVTKSLKRQEEAFFAQRDGQFLGAPRGPSVRAPRIGGPQGAAAAAGP
eukprot:TRINITY_DN60562_c0_g1_i1.p1 TRINITY_DN60562_c0_g1~~TRINITY_DN60562_c0_g1_i1.p1  ORF type:complete len:461 (+),score=129.56 TRINITY_DN60562_c0_g1_i1:70-1452(+)